MRRSRLRSAVLAAASTALLLPVAPGPAVHGAAPGAARPAAARPAAVAVPAADDDETRPDRRDAAPSRDQERPTTGLEVTMERVSPASLERGTSVQISGTVTNLDPERWIDLQASLVVDDAAITTPDQLAAALDSPADTYNGARILEDGTYDELGSLAPGESTPYSLSVPFRLLGLDEAERGVYTVSVHVLGERVDQGRIDGADGRARTLIPYLSEEDDPVGLAVVVPLHHEIVRLPDGTIDDVEELVRSVSSGGLLRNRLDLVAGADTGQATLMVDPALIDALRSIAADQFGPGEASPDEEAEDDEEEPEPPTDAQLAALEFLDRLELASARSEVLVEPYGRADLTAVAQRPDLRLGRTIRQVAAKALEAASVTGAPVHVPRGELMPSPLRAVARGRTLLVNGGQVEGWSLADGPRARLVSEDARPVPLVVADSTLDSGGLAPGPSDGAPHVRQRLLAEAAVLSVGGGATELVFVPGDDWDPGPGTVGGELFDLLDTPWTYSASFGSVAAGRSARVRAAEQDAAPPPLPTYVLQAAASLRRRATTLDTITGRENGLLPFYQRTAALAISSLMRDDPAAAAALANDAAASIEDQLSRITVEGPEFVTLSSSRGNFPITITNRLDQPVTVGARIFDEDRLLTFDDVEPQTLAPGSQVTLTITVEAPDVGVTDVNAQLITEAGRPFGKPIEFPIRSSVVGTVIWYAMGAVGVFLLLLVVRRIGRRLRRTAVAPQAPPEPAP